MAIPRIHPKTLESMARGDSMGLGVGQVVPHFLLMRDSRILPYAEKIWQKSGGDIDKFILGVFDFVTKNVGYEYDSDKTGLTEYVGMPYETLMDGWGDCDCSAVLMVSMLTPKGIPCHMALGYAGSSSHRWVEAKYKGDWYIFDTTNGDAFPFDRRYEKGYMPFFYVTPHSFRAWFMSVPLYLP